MTPQFSIITVVRNGAAHIEQTLKSVQAQTGVTFEHLVVDGDSTDGTTEIVKRYQSGLAWWISEPDAGIADAMNKAVARARGEWLLFLHADDYLKCPETLSRTRPFLSNDWDLVACCVDYALPTRSIVRRPTWGARINIKTTLLHQACFFKRSLFDRIGLYDPSYRITMDYEYFLRAYRAGCRVRLVPSHVVSVMRSTGISGRRDWPELRRRFAEERRVHRQHASTADFLMYSIYWSVYPSYRRALEALRQIWQRATH